MSILKHALLATAVAATFGILHDQITFSIGPSYYHAFKFEQFSSFDFGLPDRIFVSIIGVLATWWVGLIIGWIHGRFAYANHPAAEATSKARRALAFTFALTISFGILMYIYAVTTETTENIQYWRSLYSGLSEAEAITFRQVGCIHNGGYIGAILGGIGSIFYLLKGISKKGKKEVAVSGE